MAARIHLSHTHTHTCTLAHTQSTRWQGIKLSRCHIAATPSLSKHWVNTSAAITSTWRQHYGGPKATAKIDKPAEKRCQQPAADKEIRMLLLLASNFYPINYFICQDKDKTAESRQPAAAEGNPQRRPMDATWHKSESRSHIKTQNICKDCLWKCH